ncbi:MAG: hypothetical protein WAV31_03095 [Candidatus Moraniibacteriota bacterium]
MKKHHWHEIFVAESVIEVVNALRACGIVVEYDERIQGGSALGHIGGSGGIIMGCSIWRKDRKIEILLTERQEARTCIELQGSSHDFLRLVGIIERTLVVIGEDCSFCNQREVLE